MGRMPEDFDPHGTCPCGSGKPYSTCCALKNFSYEYNANGELVRVLTVDEEMLDALGGVSQAFEDLYGRPLEKSETLFGHVTDPTDSVYSMARHLIRAGLDESYAYAFTRTDGLIVTEFNVDSIPDSDLDAFTEHVDLYKETLNGSAENGNLDALAFVSKGNAYLRDVTEFASSQINMVVTDFLSRHLPVEYVQPRLSPSRFSGANFKLKTPLDYALFSALRFKKTAKSIDLLSQAGHPESVYALARSFYENTLFLDRIVSDESFFWKSIAPKSNEEDYSFGQYPDGRTNFNHVVHRVTGERISVVLRVSDLALADSAPSYVKELYSLFYVVACQYAHVDVLSAPLLFDDPDPFDQLDPSLIAMVVSTALAGDFIRAIAGVSEVQPQFSIDVKTFLLNLREQLAPAINLCRLDLDHPNPIMEALAQMIERWD